MALKRLSLKTSHQQKGMRLDQLLAEWLPEALARPISKAKARKLIVAGAVYLNGKRVRIASKELQANAQVDAYVDLAKLLENDGRAQDREFKMESRHILFEDEDLIAVDKPPGLPTQPTLDEARDNLYAAVKKFLAERDRLVQPYVGLHHRLDRDTSGVVLFTKRKEANAGIAAAFSEHWARKTYNALTVRPGQLPETDWDVKNYLGKAPGTGKRTRFTEVRSGGDFAHTDFKRIEILPRALWVEARPLTGRTHQIRVHLSEAGLPILGDSTYGMESANRGGVPRLMLHALKLEFPHPLTQAKIAVESPIPADFKACLDSFRRG